MYIYIYVYIYICIYIYIYVSFCNEGGLDLSREESPRRLSEGSAGKRVLWTSTRGHRQKVHVWVCVCACVVRVQQLGGCVCVCGQSTAIASMRTANVS
jgi:hypothetical protein